MIENLDAVWSFMVICLDSFQQIVPVDPGGWVIGLYEVPPITCFMEVWENETPLRVFLGRAAIDSCQMLADLICDVTST